MLITLSGGDGNDLLQALFSTASFSDDLIVTGLGGDDVIETFYGLRAQTTVRGGDGADRIQVNDLRQTRFVNGNAGNDEINTPVRSDFTCQGGKGNDIINISSDSYVSLQSQMLFNGNMGDDIINYRSRTAVSNCTVRGGQGNDIINIENNRIEEYSDSYSIEALFVGDLDDDSFYLNAPKNNCKISVEGGTGVDTLRLPLPDKQYFKGATYDGAAVVLNFEYQSGQKTVYFGDGTGMTVPVYAQSSIYIKDIEHVFFGGVEIQI
jgi:Ca2+-binding RTX toxin-like protein